MHTLFVYGTLAPNEENHYLLENIAGDWQPATLRGWTRDTQWEQYSGYPGIRPSTKNSTVKGHLLCADSLSEHWERLDEFEGDAYARVIVKAHINNEQIVEAHAYAIRNV